MKTIPRLLLFFTAVLPAAEAAAPEAGADSRTVLEAIHSSELRAVMARLDRLTFEHEYPELELDRRRAENIRALVDAALELNRAARQLPLAGRDMQLDAEDRITFRALAGELYRRTRILERTVEAGNYSALESGYRELRHTCNACHQLFREQ